MNSQETALKLNDEVIKPLTTLASLALDPLYKRDSKGNIQIWQISVDHEADRSIIRTTHGRQDGKLQTAEDVITEGKNIGKANATTFQQQAESEAYSRWTKQVDRKGYVPKLEALDIDSRPGAEPMLAQRFDKYPEKIQYPCFIQPKLDGHRCIAMIDTDGCRLFSRTRTEILGVPHINRYLYEFASINLPKEILEKGIILDGELYNHEYKSRFEELTGFIRSETPKEGHEVVQYHVYDMIWNNDYILRKTFIDTMFSGLAEDAPIKIVSTFEIEEDAVSALFKGFRNEGYEGAMLRNKLGYYEGRRSYNLLKVKEFADDEFIIKGVEEGRGKMKGHAIFVCLTKCGQEFRAKMKGSMESLKVYFEKPETIIGRLVTVQFQDYTSDGIPRFPVAIRFKEDL